uniref:Uncharacterized protein n=1 Tax=viral metagenome TaxID=1070528 RepID=A0A6C0JYN4_9ZZZZ
MLVFRGGKWHTVAMPVYVDPSWGFGDRQKVASIIVRERARGLSETEAFLRAEGEHYMSLGNNIAPQRTKKNMAV